MSNKSTSTAKKAVQTRATKAKAVKQDRKAVKVVDAPKAVQNVNGTATKATVKGGVLIVPGVFTKRLNADAPKAVKEAEKAGEQAAKDLLAANAVADKVVQAVPKQVKVKKLAAQIVAKAKKSMTEKHADEIDSGLLLMIYDARQAGASYNQLEETFSLKKTNGNTAWRLIRRAEKIMAEK